MKRMAALIALTCLATMTAHADWSLSNDGSRVSFVSTKAGSVAEVHHFKSISGTIDAAGKVEVTIQLASVDTMIPLRDERMRDMLFEVARFPTASVMASIDPAVIDGLAAGQTTTLTVQAQLSMRGQTLAVPLELVVAKLGNSRVLVSTVQPTVVNASQVDLVAGIEALRDIAGLPSISPAVPVSVVLAFEKKM